VPPAIETEHVHVRWYGAGPKMPGQNENGPNIVCSFETEGEKMAVVRLTRRCIRAVRYGHGSIDKGLHKKHDHAAIRPLAIEMPISIGQSENSITDVPMTTVKRNLASTIDVRDHSLENVHLKPTHRRLSHTIPSFIPCQ